MTCPSEYEEQVAFIHWFKLRFPDVLIWANEAAGRKTLLQGVRLKKQGVLAGVPDIFIPPWFTFIEMKRKRMGKLSDSQRAVMGKLQQLGYKVFVCAGAEDAIRVCQFLTNKIPHLREPEEKQNEKRISSALV
jgi:hypothetical protein